MLTFQRAIYHKVQVVDLQGNPLPILPAHVGQWWYLYQLVGVIVVGLVIFAVALKVFGRLEGNFAEEL